MALEPSMALGYYEVLSSLGAGGMGEVYRAKDTKLGREVQITPTLAPGGVGTLSPERRCAWYRTDREWRL